MKAVPEKAQANGRRYQGAYAIAAKLAAIAVTDSTTADQALRLLISKTCSSVVRCH